MTVKVWTIYERIKEIGFLRRAGYACLHYTSNLGTCVQEESWNSLIIRDPNGIRCVTEMSHFNRPIPNFSIMIPNNYDLSEDPQQMATYLRKATPLQTRRDDKWANCSCHINFTTYYAK